MAGGVTIRDVALAAQVSVATVSRALNGQANVTDEVRKRVLAAAQQLRYTPHAAARSLSSRRTHAIGVVLPDLYGEFFSELVRGIDQVAREHGLHLLVSSYHGHREEQGDAMRAMRGRVDGLLLMSPYAAADGMTAESLAPGLPTVLINSQDAGEGSLALGVANYEGARAMLAHLVSNGYRRIAFIAGPEDNFDAYQRRSGYRDALAELLPDAGEWVLPGSFDEASGNQAGLELLASPKRPDAVFAANDMMALGCLFAFTQAGLRVPHDIAIAGFDDIPLARFVHPGLTTMRVDIFGLGASAARMLLARLAGTEPPQAQPLVPQLVVRQSTIQT
ncbi:LacI family DNA-binding transcriptional regulator [Lysobacter niabensis]|uniref:LacI family DNA-binding transcriptional regulator n=1 Tax=Agrilutibacter niabensis TaxID=380628 RepID=UPI00360D60AE